MRLISLDLELEQPCNTIIQIGYVIGELETGEILRRRCLHVKIDAPVSDYIQNLTGISDAENKLLGMTLPEAYDQVTADVKELKPFINPLTWGGGDAELVRTQMGLDGERFIFGRRWIDVKTVFIANRMRTGAPFFGGLGKSMARMGLKFEGRKHNALADAENTFIMYRRLLGFLEGKS